MPDLGVIVAGLNSTMAMSHRAEDDNGELGLPQLSWFTERLKKHDRLVVAAVYHDGMTLPSADITLYASIPGGHELTTVRIREWDVSQFTGLRRLVGRLAKPPGLADSHKVHTGAVHALAFSDNGWLLASGAADGTAMIWTSAMNLVAIIRGHLGSVRAVAFSPDTNRLATACEDRAVRIWDIRTVTTPLLVITLLDLPDGGYAAVLPDGQYSCTANRPTICGGRLSCAGSPPASWTTTSPA